MAAKKGSGKPSRGRTKIQTNVYLTADQWIFVHDEAKQRGCPAAQVIRDAIDEKRRAAA